MAPAQESVRRRSARRGLTLIEVLISLVILALVLLTFLSVVVSAESLRASSREASIALQDLQSAVEYTVGVPFDKFKQIYPGGTYLDGRTAADGTVLPNFTDGPTNPRPLKGETVLLTWLEWDPNPAVEWVEYKLEVTWTDHRRRTVRDSLITRRSR